jgi:hypothetical protein
MTFLPDASAKPRAARPLSPCSKRSGAWSAAGARRQRRPTTQTEPAFGYAARPAQRVGAATIAPLALALPTEA